MKKSFPVEKLNKIATPYYYYDMELLRETILAIKKETEGFDNYHVHYAVKANVNPKILEVIRDGGLGVDCVSGGEIQAALNAGFTPDTIVYAGVGKSDWEINLGLDNEILCFNVESIAELEVINELAGRKGKIAKVAFRINPNVGAHTHSNITTGLAENKFGIAMEDMVGCIRTAQKMQNVRFIGLHFHIGSQILELDDFKSLCERINQLQDELDKEGICVENINVGGGLGVDYDNPDDNPMPNLKGYFDVYKQHLKLRKGQQLHFELGRAVVAQCGSLITRVLYVKRGKAKQFAIVDAGMTDLMRPALYGAHHKIENITSTMPEETYDVVGPICESTDVFENDVMLKGCSRGDLIAIRSAGAYGEIMASQYNCRKLPKGYTGDEDDES